MKSSLLTFAFFGSLLFNYCYAQPSKTDKYVIIAFEHWVNISPHGMQKYYWIIPQDSIQRGKVKIAKLFVGEAEYTVANFKDCCNGKPIDPMVHFANSRWDFSKGYDDGLDSLRTIITRHRVLIQTMEKNWKGGNKETLKIFATPLIGKFCKSLYKVAGNNKQDYSGYLYIPYSSFVHYKDFWSTGAAKILSNKEFSQTYFSAFQY